MRAIAKPHTHKNGLNSGKNQGKNTPPRTPPNIRWFNRRNPRNQGKIRKKWVFLGGGWGGREYRITTQNPPKKRAKVPRSRKEMRRCYIYVFLFDFLFVGLLLASSGVFWGGIRYSLHVFSVRRLNSPTHHRDERRNTYPIIG